MMTKRGRLRVYSNDDDESFEARNRRLRDWEIRRLKFVGGLVALGTVGVAVSLVGWTFFEAANSGGDERTKLMQSGLASLAAIVLAIFAGWRAYVLQGQLDHDRAEASERRRDEQRKRLDERFGEAAVLIGHDKEDTRVAGLLALERLLKEDQFEDEHWTIVQLLVSFVRARTREERQPGCAEDDSKSPPPAQDAQVALSIIGRRPRSEKRKEQVLDLAGLHLEGANLPRANLRFACLRGTHLEGANLFEACLEGADLRGARLDDAQLFVANFSSAHLHESNLSRANVAYACLTSAVFHGAHLEEADLSGARLDGAILHDAHLDDAVGLTHAQASKAESLPDGLLERLLAEESDGDGTPAEESERPPDEAASDGGSAHGHHAH